MINQKQRLNLFWLSFKAILKKELIHITRSPIAFVFTFIFPFIDLIILGCFLDINVKQINTVVYDLAKTQESRLLIENFANTKDFKIVNNVNSDKELYNQIISGKAKVGIKIPFDYSKRLLNGDTTSVLVLIDGSNANVTAETLTVSNNIALQQSIKPLLNKKETNIPVESRISVLFNPETRSPNFLLPGVIVFVLPTITVILAAFSIATEREKGTMDQLSMTQINPTGLIFGKMLPYGLVAFVQLVFLVLSIKFLFQVPINGNILTLLILSIPFLTASLGLGFIVAARANSQVEVMSSGFLVRVIGPLYLSGYIFPIEGMPYICQLLTYLVPERYFLEIVRGVILRGAGFADLSFQTTILSIMTFVFLLIAIRMYNKKLV